MSCVAWGEIECVHGRGQSWGGCQWRARSCVESLSPPQSHSGCGSGQKNAATGRGWLEVLDFSD